MRITSRWRIQIRKLQQVIALSFVGHCGVFAASPPTPFNAMSSLSCPEWDKKKLLELSLEAAVRRAICVHPKLLEAKASVQVEQEQRQLLVSQDLPTVSLSSSYSRSKNSSESFLGPVVDRTQGRANAINLNWPLFDFGVRSAQRRASVESIRAAAAGYDTVVQDVFIAVVDAFLLMQSNEAQMTVIKDSLMSLNKASEIAKTRLRFGNGTPSDVALTRMKLAQAVLAQVRVADQILISKADLAIVLNEPIDADIQLKDIDVQLKSSLAASASPISSQDLTRYVDNHPRVRQAMARVAASLEQVTAAERDNFPKISLVASRYLNGRPGVSVSSKPSFDSYIGVMVSLSIFEGFASGHRINLAALQYKQALAQLEDVRNQVRAVIMRSQQALTQSGFALDAARAVVEHAKSVQSQTLLRYSNGATDVADWLQAEKSYVDALQDVLRFKQELDLAYLKLLILSGDISVGGFKDEAQQR
jgi:outer membrane protein